MDALVDSLRDHAMAIGLQVQLGLGPGYDAAAAPGLRLGDLAPWARGGLLLLSGGRTLFDRFRTETAGEPDPLDAFTRRRIEALLRPLREAGIRAEARFPFWNEPDPLPFQRIGAGAGLGSSILGLTVHPAFGTWLAYRALILLDVPVAEAEAPQPPFDPCTGCAAPCISACPGQAVSRAGWDVSSCLDQRLGEDDACAAGCHARSACPLAPGQRYAPDALRFHQAASRAAALAFEAAGR